MLNLFLYNKYKKKEIKTNLPTTSTTVRTQYRDGCSGSIPSNFIPTLKWFLVYGKGSLNNLTGAAFALQCSRYLDHENPSFPVCQGYYIQKHIYKSVYFNDYINKVWL